MQAIKSYEIRKYYQEKVIEKPDLVVVEEPLEIRLGFGDENERQQKSLSITMRTPTGHDFELALGFLFTEGVIQSINDILSIHYCTDTGRQTQANIVRVELKPSIKLDFQKLERHFYSTSSCGICGKASIEAIQTECKILPKNTYKISPDFIFSLPKTVREKQLFFEHTGGLHAAVIFNKEKDYFLLREDIGRHNALDKVIGATFQQNLLPLSDTILFMSSRASFELVQKAVMAGIPILACVGSPSSLAIETAQQFGMTLIGFLREDSFNVYTFPERIV